MSSHFIFPKPSDWNVLEDIVADVFSRKYRNYNFQRYGRSGQRQSGIDIAGPTEIGLIGIQCKHHPAGNISTNEIDRELKLSEKFLPILGEFIIATSADRDTKVHSHVMNLSAQRKTKGKYPIVIKFWDDIYNWLVEYPDLIYKHFTKHFPISDLENISIPGILDKTRNTSKWPVTLSELEASTTKTIGKINRVDPYQLVLGITSFDDVSFEGLADLDIQLSELFSTTDNSGENFSNASNILKSVKTLITKGKYSKELIVHLQTRLSLSFLIGWTFRKVSHFELTLIYSDNAWATHGLPNIPARLTEGLPDMRNPQSDEVVLVLNITRNIDPSVLKFIKTWKVQPLSVLTIAVDGHAVTSAAHALAIASELSRKVKTLGDSWGVQKIHLFGALPAALATLIGFHLNAICPIYLYYLDEDRTTYKIGGILHNSL